MKCSHKETQETPAAQQPLCLGPEGRVLCLGRRHVVFKALGESLGGVGTQKAGVAVPIAVNLAHPQRVSRRVGTQAAQPPQACQARAHTPRGGGVQAPGVPRLHGGLHRLFLP